MFEALYSYFVCDIVLCYLVQIYPVYGKSVCTFEALYSHFVCDIVFVLSGSDFIQFMVRACVHLKHYTVISSVILYCAIWFRYVEFRGLTRRRGRLREGNSVDARGLNLSPVSHRMLKVCSCWHENWHTFYKNLRILEFLQLFSYVLLGVLEFFNL